jgi:multiple sugar transport system ATP-binding protein
MIAGLEEPSEGEIRIGSRVVNDLPPKDRDVAMVFQNYGLYPHMTIAQNIGYPLRVRGIGGTERDRLIRVAAEKVELGNLMHRRPRELSGGQRQRVALARAIVRKPVVFLMDEPLSNLDAKLRVSMRAEIKHLQAELGVTTIYVTHDQIEAMTLAHRVAVMDGGVIQQLGTPEEIYDKPANLFVAGFIGSPAMNLVQGELRQGRFEAAPVHVDGIEGFAGPVILGVRPEDVTVVPAGQGDFDAPVYTVELTGESVQVTLDTGTTRLVAKADRVWRAGMGTLVGVKINTKRLHLFNASTGMRMDM